MPTTAPDPSPAPVHVVAAVIRSPAGEILIARRPGHVREGGLWEFPGGKCEPDESAIDALRRELNEELGINIQSAMPLIQVRHHYDYLDLLLDVFVVERWHGEAHGREGQEVRWVSAAELGHYEFPAANRPIVLAASLPRWMPRITLRKSAIADVLEVMRHARGNGLRKIVVELASTVDPAAFLKELAARKVELDVADCSVVLDVHDAGAACDDVSPMTSSSVQMAVSFKRYLMPDAAENNQKFALLMVDSSNIEHAAEAFAQGALLTAPPRVMITDDVAALTEAVARGCSAIALNLPEPLATQADAWSETIREVDARVADVLNGCCQIPQHCS
ncbi:MAG: NUDIX domain-containing protein [Gammaproteobacteria bacterium]|nr:NUDIX domain-containing protein [Gammaproteobacteria bacterium]